LVDKLKISVLVDDSKNPLKPELQAKHGLSFYIEAEVKDEKITLLLDTGPSAETILHNADRMEIDLSKIDLIFLSHGHYDHVNGLIGVLKRKSESTIVLAHPQAFDSKFVYRPHLKYAGSFYRLSEIRAFRGMLLFAKNHFKLSDGITSSGEIQRSTTYEEVEGFWKVNNDLFVQDAMLDDQSLIVNMKGKGLVVIAGCAHAGIINTIKQAQRITGMNRIHAVIGGFHLKDAADDRITSTIEELSKIKPSIIRPCHCTGSRAVKELTDTFNDRCKLLRVGIILELNGN